MVQMMLARWRQPWAFLARLRCLLLLHQLLAQRWAPQQQHQSWWRWCQQMVCVATVGQTHLV